MVDQQQRADEHEAGEEHSADASEWEDVTNAFRETASSLGEGELLESGYIYVCVCACVLGLECHQNQWYSGVCLRFLFAAEFGMEYS